MIEAMDRFWRDRTGLAAVEYAITGSLISIALVGAFVLLGGGIENAVDSVAAAISERAG